MGSDYSNCIATEQLCLKRLGNSFPFKLLESLIYAVMNKATDTNKTIYLYNQ